MRAEVRGMEPGGCLYAAMQLQNGREAEWGYGGNACG